MKLKSNVVMWVAGILAAVSGCHQSDAVEPPSVPSTATDEITVNPGNPQLRFLKIEEVRPKPASGLTAVTGKISFDEDHTSRVGSPISGRVDRLLVKPGDVIKKGQALLTIVSSEVEAALADVRSADEGAALAARNLDRVRGLYEDHAVPRKEVSNAESDLVQSQSSRERARARMALLGLAPNQHSSQFTLRAPLAGTVVERSVLPGSEVRADATTPLVTISNLSRVWVQADVYERDLQLVSAGQSADLHIASYPGESFPAHVDHVGDVVDPETRTVKLRLSANNSEGRLKPEMFARVALRLASASNVIMVPSEAVLSDGVSSVVIVCDGERKFSKRKVEAGVEESGGVRITAGLKVGERIVTQGALFVRAEIENR